ncbi:MAG: 2-amino-4-hydroxy-6-hydroxymethyldihydropteridine diphosphokinase [Candidatus Methylomirabilales bacterium]
MAIAYVGLGGSVGDRLRWLTSALAEFARGVDLRLAGFSSIFETEPVGVTGHDWYLNAVAAVSTALPPEALLERLQAIEASFGRPRHRLPGAARTLDLDLLLLGDVVRQSPALTLPHPRLAERRFVLEPLCEIAPNLRHPILGSSVRELLAALPAGPTVRLFLPRAALKIGVTAAGVRP